MSAVEAEQHFCGLCRKQLPLSPLTLRRSRLRSCFYRFCAGRGGGGGALPTAVEKGFVGDYGRNFSHGQAPAGSRIWLPGHLDLPADYGFPPEVEDEEEGGGPAAGSLDEPSAGSPRRGPAADRSVRMRPEDVAATEALASRQPSEQYLIHAEAMRSLRLRDGGGLTEMLGIDLEAAAQAVQQSYAQARQLQMEQHRAAYAADGEGGDAAAGASEADAAAAVLPTLETLWELQERQPLHLLLHGPAFGLDFAPAAPLPGEVWVDEARSELLRCRRADGSLQPSASVGGRPIRWSNTTVNFISRASPFRDIISEGDPLVAIDGACAAGAPQGLLRTGQQSGLHIASGSGLRLFAFLANA